jgi:Sel1 repeat
MTSIRRVRPLFLSLLAAGCAASQLAGDPRVGQALTDPGTQRQFRSYLGQPDPKAFAFSPETGREWHAWGYPTLEQSKQVALSKCEELTGRRCVLFAVNDEIVWRPGVEAEEPAAAPPLGRAELEALRQSAEGGSAKAQVDLGNRYLHGIGVERDPVEARRWYRLAADKGDGLAALELGLIYEKGLGVSPDRQEAARWFAAGAKAGNAAAIAKAKEYGVAG